MTRTISLFNPVTATLPVDQDQEQQSKQEENNVELNSSPTPLVRVRSHPLPKGLGQIQAKLNAVYTMVKETSGKGKGKEITGEQKGDINYSQGSIGQIVRDQSPNHAGDEEQLASHHLVSSPLEHQNQSTSLSTHPPPASSPTFPLLPTVPILSPSAHQPRPASVRSNSSLSYDELSPPRSKVHVPLPVITPSPVRSTSMMQERRIESPAAIAPKGGHDTSNHLDWLRPVNAEDEEEEEEGEEAIESDLQLPVAGQYSSPGRQQRDSSMRDGRASSTSQFDYNEEEDLLAEFMKAEVVIKRGRRERRPRKSVEEMEGKEEISIPQNVEEDGIVEDHEKKDSDCIPSDEEMPEIEATSARKVRDESETSNDKDHSRRHSRCNSSRKSMLDYEEGDEVGDESDQAQEDSDEISKRGKSKSKQPARSKASKAESKAAKYNTSDLMELLPQRKKRPSTMYSSSSPQSVPKKKKKAPVPKSSSSVVKSTSKKQKSVKQRQRQEDDEDEEEEDESDVTDYSEPEPYVSPLFLHFISSLDDDMITVPRRSARLERKPQRNLRRRNASQVNLVRVNRPLCDLLVHLGRSS
jgi:hypothetical protein